MARRGSGRAAAAAVALLCGGLVGAGCDGAPAEVRSGRWVAAEARALEETLVELGEVVSHRVVTVNAVTGGEIIWLVDEGSEVTAGAEVATFNGEDLEESVASKTRDVQTLRQAFDNEQEALRGKRAEMRLETRKRELEVEAARVALQELLEEATQEQIARGEVELDRANFEYEEAQREVERMRRLFGTGVATKEEVTDAEESLRKQAIERRRAADTLDAVREGPDARIVAESKLKIDQAVKALARQRRTEKETIALYESRVTIAETKRKKAESQLTYERERLEGCRVLSPVAGRAVFHRVWKGEENQSRVEVGETVSRNSELMKIADLDRLEVRLLVNEVDVARLKTGLEADIELVALPGRRFSGRITSIADVASDKNKRLGELALMRSGEAGVAVVDVAVAILDPAPEIRLGFSARVTLRLATHDAAVAVPAGAVTIDDDGRRVVVTRAGDRPVTVGRAGREWVEITDGIDAGEDVFVGW